MDTLPAPCNDYKVEREKMKDDSAEMKTLSLHECRECGCLWRRWEDGTWSIHHRWMKPEACCDNSPDFLSKLNPPIPEKCWNPAVSPPNNPAPFFRLVGQIVDTKSYVNPIQPQWNSERYGLPIGTMLYAVISDTPTRAGGLDGEHAPTRESAHHGSSERDEALEDAARRAESVTCSWCGGKSPKMIADGIRSMKGIYRRES